MNLLLLIISSLMAVVMLVVGSLLTSRRKAPLGRRTLPPLAALLAFGSFGGFYAEANNVVVQGHPYDPFALSLGFLLAIAAGALFLWQRSKIS
jgi:protein-S-isoprenylcysteine O-methyltransferase Ste14